MINLAEVRAAIKELHNRSTVPEPDSPEATIALAETYDKTLVNSDEPNPCLPTSEVLLSDPCDTVFKTRDITSRSATLPINSPLRNPRIDWSSNVINPKYSVDAEFSPGPELPRGGSDDMECQITFNGQQTVPRGVSSHLRHSTNNLGTAMRKPEQTLSETLAVLTHRLAEKRCSAKRPECLQLMTRKQIEEEKLDLQKALLYFEGLHGRPSGRHERLIMRPLYDRYRSVKRMLNQESQMEKSPPASVEAFKTAQCENKHVVSSEGDSGQTDNPLSSSTSAHVRPFVLDDPREVWDKGTQSKFATLPNALTHLNEYRESTPSEILGQKHTVQNDTKSISVGSLSQSTTSCQAKNSRMHRSELHLAGYNASSQSDDRRTPFRNPSAGDGDVDTRDRIGLSGSGFRRSSVLGSGSSSMIDQVQLTDTGANMSATYTPSFGLPHSSSHTANLVIEKDSSVTCSLSGLTLPNPIGRNEATEDDPKKWPLSRLRNEVTVVRESKRQLQKILKEFEHDFEQTTGHKVERADRSSMRNEYTRYKFLKSRLALLEAELRSRVN
ncbi:unnamed protein product [Echinostoma caproni]|uniref:ALMS_motif domain-containing protein n=1 Tax=Echinostoma caproni TaxID=27848 RepID=A0A183ATP3_9TREM|nr:unnamed protein product [Echinostoma caproni]